MDTTPSDRATLLITVGSASVAFTVGFNMGAFGVVFFDQLLAVWVIATIILGASRRLVLLVPSLWIVAAWIDNTYSFTADDRIVFALTVTVTMFVIPVVAWILITAINTDFAELPGRNKGIIIGTVGLFIVIGFGIGARNDMILNCGDFKISGNDLPANCVPVAPDQ